MKNKMMKVAALVFSTAILTSSAVCAEEVDEVALTAISGTAGANDSEGFENLFDDDVETKWCVTSFDWAYAIWEYEVPVTVEGFSITTANDNAEYPGRNPSAWSIYGYNGDSAPAVDDDGWVELVSVEGDTTLQDENYGYYYYAIGESCPAYQYYMLIVDENGGAGEMQMSEFSLSYTVEEDDIVSFFNCWESYYVDTWLIFYEDGTYAWYEDNGDEGTVDGDGEWTLTENGEMYIDDSSWGEATYSLILGDSDGDLLHESDLPDYDDSSVDAQVGNLISCWKYDEASIWLGFYDDGSAVMFGEEGDYIICGWYEDGDDKVVYELADEDNQLLYSPYLMNEESGETWFISELP